MHSKKCGDQGTTVKQKTGRERRPEGPPEGETKRREKVRYSNADKVSKVNPRESSKAGRRLK